MKKWIVIIVVLGMLGYATYDFISDKQEAKKAKDSDDGAMISAEGPDGAADADEANSVGAGLKKGEKAPDFELETLDGDKARLSDYRGKPVLVNFWTTWCPPCRAEIPDLKKLYDKKDVPILAVNMTHLEENEAKIKEFVKEFDMPFPVLKDTDGDLMTAYAIQAYPTTYYINSDGTIQYVALGAMNYEQMLQQYEKLS